MKTILIPIPAEGFDPSETALPWRVLSNAGHELRFATPDGARGACDPIMLSGHGLGPLSPALAADPRARAAYREMEATAAFRAPLRWEDCRADQFDGLLLPGGHAKSMRPYLESTVLQRLVADFAASGKPWGAICHGVVLAARSSGSDGRSVLHGRRTTALLASQELLAWGLTVGWMGDYYRTYPETVEAEVRRLLRDPSDFVRGPLPLLRDDPDHLDRGFALRDGSYLSARWPGDAHRFATTYREMLG